MKQVLGILLALVMALAFGACANPSAPPGNTSPGAGGPNEPASGEPIYFAYAGPLTGDARQYGEPAKAAIEIAVDDINARGGILGRELIVDFYDDKNDATEAINVANLIVDAGKYTAVLGHMSSTCSMATAPIYNDAQLIMYSATASHEDFTSLGEYVFRGLLTQTTEARAYADFLYNDLGFQSVGVLFVNDDWGKNVTDHFTAYYQELGGTLTTVESFIPGQTRDFSPMISKIKATEPDALVTIALYPDTAQVLIQADALDFKVPMVVSTAAFKVELIDVAGPLANGVILLNVFPTDYEGAEFNRVMDLYEQKIGKAGEYSVMVNYNVVGQIANAITLAGATHSAAVREILAATPYEGLTGVYEMSEKGDSLYRLIASTIIDGRFAAYRR